MKKIIKAGGRQTVQVHKYNRRRDQGRTLIDERRRFTGQEEEGRISVEDEEWRKKTRVVQYQVSQCMSIFYKWHLFLVV